ncbi:MAG: lactonase family protein [Dehalococcoidia bacterium]|nr:lactonase family protein [Dehalococcoidia bacterium]
MNTRDKSTIIALSAVVLPLLATTSCSCGGNSSKSAFVMTNANRNSIIPFIINDNGALVASSSVATQGNGSGISINPLSSQSSLIVSGDRKWLVALNAGSNEISVFKITNNGISFTSKSSSLGQLPVSVASTGSRVFVLNRKGLPNVRGFNINKKGELVVIDKNKAVISLTPGPSYSQIGISPNNKWLVISDETNSLLLVYTLNRDTISKDYMSLPTSGKSPASFTFDKKNNLLVVESSSSTVSSYAISKDGIVPITEALLLGQPTPRWIVSNGNYAYITHFGNDTISSLQINNGHLTLGKRFYTGSNNSTEIAINSSGEYVYIVNPRSNKILRFIIEKDGDLTLADSVDDYFGVPTQGIAAT